MRNETFGRLLKAGLSSAAHCEGLNSSDLEGQVGKQIGVAGTTIQNYKAGNVPQDARTIRLLAEVAVKRGHQDRVWLTRFLDAAAYPSPQSLVDELCPNPHSSTSHTQVYHNLPASTYSKFVARPKVQADLMDGLQQRSPVVLLIGLGGMGKTSLAYEVARHVLQQTSAETLFTSVVWLSDKDHPATTNLTIVLDKIARTLDYASFASYEFEEKRRAVERLLRQQRVLIVVDNFETITDDALLRWLQRLPEPSKALVTTREYSRAFRNNTFVVDLHGMELSEAQQFICQRLQFLHLDHVVEDLEQLAPFIHATGGNPKAIELALGCIRYDYRPFQDVIADLYAARGEIFEDLFTRSWSLLDEATRRVFLSTPLFQENISEEALAASADVYNPMLQPSIERLRNLALIDALHISLAQTPRYTIHPLVRAFATAKLSESAEFQQGARERWVKWYIDYAADVGYCWNDATRLTKLDPDQGTIHTVLQWCHQHHRHIDVIKLAHGVGYYYLVRGLWEKNPPCNLAHAEAARQLEDPAEEMQGLSYHVHMLCRQGRAEVAARYLERLLTLVSATKPMGNLIFDVQHAIALDAMTRNDYAVAQEAWESSLSHRNEFTLNIVVVNQQWLSTSLLAQGKFAEAEVLLEETLSEAIRLNMVRSRLFCMIRIADVVLQQGDIERAALLLSECRDLAAQNKDREHIAESQRISARLYMAQGEYSAAQAALLDAIDNFERLGLQRELEAARDELVLVQEREQR